MSLYKHCAQLFEDSFRPDSNSIGARIGAEIELCLVRRKVPLAEPAGHTELRNLLSALSSNYKSVLCRETGRLIALIDSSGTKLAPDFSTCTFEISLAPCNDLTQLQSSLKQHLLCLVTCANALGLELLGTGVHPFVAPSPELIFRDNPRYRLTGLDFLQTTGQAIHATIDVNHGNSILAYRAFSKAAPILIALCANSSRFCGRDTGISCIRELFWDTAILDPSRVGIGFEAESIGDYFSKLAELPISRVVRQSRTLHFIESISFKDFLHGNFVMAGDSLHTNFKRVCASLDFIRDDLAMHESTAWFNSRLRFRNSTLEIRSMDTPPLNHLLMPLVLVRGLSFMISELNELVRAFTIREAQEARRNAIHLGLRGIYESWAISDLASVVLDIAQRGLALSGESSYCEYLNVYRDLVNAPSMKRNSPGLTNTRKPMTIPHRT